MKKFQKALVLILALTMMLSINVTAFASNETEFIPEGIVTEVENEMASATYSSVVSVFEYSSSNFYIENNQGKFTPSFNSKDARIVVGAKRADNVYDGTITVTVYKKNLIGKSKVKTFTCQADGKGHTSGSFEIKKNANYVVDITTSTAQRSIVAVNIAAVKN